jgi:hypothetical protein
MVGIFRLRCELASIVFTVGPTCKPMVGLAKPPPPTTF